MRGVPRERLAISRAPASSIGRLEDAGRAQHDLRELRARVELEMLRDAEAIAQRRRRAGPRASSRRRA